MKKPLCLKTSEISVLYHNLLDKEFNDNEIDVLFDCKSIDTINEMNAKDIKLAMGCEHNKLWLCQHDSSYGQDCNGPCKHCTTTQIHFEDYICPICGSSADDGYCVNKLCVNHG